MRSRKGPGYRSLQNSGHGWLGVRAAARSAMEGDALASKASRRSTGAWGGRWTSNMWPNFPQVDDLRFINP